MAGLNVGSKDLSPSHQACTASVLTTGPSLQPTELILGNHVQLEVRSLTLRKKNNLTLEGFQNMIDWISLLLPSGMSRCLFIAVSVCQQSYRAWLFSDQGSQS